MSLPRIIRCGSYYLLTRRVAHREFLLRPGPITNQVMRYAIAYAALVTGVRVHAVIVMSDHIHLVVSDPWGVLPAFLATLHRHVACCMNRVLDRRESLWSSDEPSVVRLESDDAIIDAIAYVIANPVAAGLVEHPSEWPGLSSSSKGFRATATRPSVFYRANGKMPDAIDLEVAPPKLSNDESAANVVQRIDEMVATKIRAAREALVAERRAFVGAKAVLEVPRSTRATKFEPRRSLRPRFATKNTARGLEALARLRAFYAHYKRAFEAWRSGNREVVFPAGTYAMSRFHGARVEPDPSPPLALASSM